MCLQVSAFLIGCPCIYLFVVVWTSTHLTLSIVDVTATRYTKTAMAYKLKTLAC